MLSVEVWWWSPMTSGKILFLSTMLIKLTYLHRLLDKIAKDILVCENKTIRRWDGTIGEYKNYLRKKMVTMGQV